MVGNPDFLTVRGQDITADIQELESPEGELHLRFFVPSGEEFALPAIGIKEVMQQPPDRITAIPNASPLLLGTINLRGEVIWVADLGQFLGESAMLNTERPEIPVITIEDQETILGLAIDRLGDMDWLDPEQISLSNNIPDSMAPFVQGEWIINAETNKYLRLLDHVAILRTARWAA
jgi:twitching motility protein PilI